MHPMDVDAPSLSVPLDGEWRFRIDGPARWREVAVPHTWQTAPETAEYYGVAWYARSFDVPAEWSGSIVRIEFEAVFHSATVWVNGALAGEHLRRGYTAFTLDLTPRLKFGARNTLRVRVANSFDDATLPRGRSSDWAHDGGIYRPVRLLVTPPHLRRATGDRRRAGPRDRRCPPQRQSHRAESLRHRLLGDRRPRQRANPAAAFT